MNSVSGRLDFIGTDAERLAIANPVYGMRFYALETGLWHYTTSWISTIGAGPLSGITSEGGYYITVTAGEALTRGEVVQITQAGGADGKVFKNAVGSDMPIGVVFANALINTSVKIIVSGIAYVLPEPLITATRGYVIYSGGTTAGRVDQAATVPATTTHFKEVGHFLDTGSGNGAITRAILHFN